VLIDLIATLQHNLAMPTHILLDPLGWAAFRRLKVGGSNTNESLLGAGTTDATAMLLSLPVIVDPSLPSNAGLVIDKRAIVSAVGSIQVATSEHQYFSSTNCSEGPHGGSGTRSCDPAASASSPSPHRSTREHERTTLQSATGDNPPMGDPADRFIQVGLAEYNQLRAELIAAQNRQGTLVGIGLTAIGVIMTIALREAGDHRLLLAVPPLGLVVTLLHLGEARRIIRIGRYIRLKLWPKLQAQSGYPESWEEEHSAHIKIVHRDAPKRASIIIAKALRDLALESPPQLLFFGIGLAALVLAHPHRLWVIVDGACLFLLAAAGIGFAVSSQRRKDTGASSAAVPDQSTKGPDS
jgi:hypothetical protein